MKKILMILFGLFVLFSSCMEKEVQQQKGNEKGNAPDFTLTLINGGTFTLSEHTGKVIILNFWATWCPPCRAEIPDFISLYKEYKDKGLMIIGISVDDSVDPVIKFAKENNIIYPVVMGNSKVTQDYGGIRGIPTSFIIDKSGNIKEKFVGYRSRDVFEEAVKKLLPEKT